MVRKIGLVNNLYDWLGNTVDSADIDPAVIESARECAAAKHLALYIAVSYVSNAISKCEIKTYNKGKQVKGELYYALNVSPNPNQCGAAMMNKLVENLFYDGESLLVQPTKGKAQFHVADSFSIDEYPLKGDVFNGISIGIVQLKKRFKAQDVCYFRLSDDHEVRKIVGSLCNDLSIIMGSAAESFKQNAGDRFTLEGEGRPSGTRGDEKTGTDETTNRLQTFLRNPRAVLPLYRNQQFSRVQPNTSAAKIDDIVAIRKDIFETTASAFHIPTSMMYGNMNNTSDIMKQFLTFGVDPIAVILDDEFNRKFFTMDEYLSGSRIHIDTSCISHVDMFDVADQVDKLISSGAVCIDEVRTHLGADELNTDYSKAHWVTKNYAPIEEALEQLQLNLFEGGE